MKISTLINKLIDASQFSFNGLKQVLATEMAFQLELMMAAILIPFAIVFGHSGVERAVLILSVMIVLIVEVINSAIETAIDYISTDHHPLAGKAKDMGSAAVFLSCLNVVVIWGVIFLS